MTVDQRIEGKRLSKVKKSSHNNNSLKIHAPWADSLEMKWNELFRKVIPSVNLCNRD